MIACCRNGGASAHMGADNAGMSVIDGDVAFSLSAGMTGYLAGITCRYTIRLMMDSL